MGRLERRCSGRVAVRSFVNALDEIAGPLEFNRKEECCRRVDAMNFKTSGVGPA